MASTAPPMPPMPPVLLAPAPVAAAPADKAARFGLVLAVLLAISGVVGAVAKAGDEPAPFAAVGTSIEDAVEEPAELGIEPIVVPDGYQLVQGDGVHLAVPGGWVDLSDEEGDILAPDDFADVFPDLDAGRREAMAAMVNDGMLVFAIDPSIEGNGNNLNVASTPGEAPLGIITKQLEREFERSGADVVVDSSGEIDTPLGRALRIAYTIGVDGTGVSSVQYYVPVAGRTIIVTVTGAVDVGDQVIQTLRLGDAPAAS